MPIGDYVRSLFSRIANGPYDKDKKDKPTTPNLANGGHTGYHPLPPKKARQKDYSADQQNMNQYTPEQIGTHTYSCALINPTSSGGIQAKTANMNIVTSERISGALSTSGVAPRARVMIFLFG